jgi:uncharacterized protein (TIGR03066 family)
MSQKKKRPPEETAVAPAPAPAPAPTNRRVWLLLILLLVASSGISFVVFRYVVAGTPREIVGVWRVVDGPLRSATLEFRPDGTATATLIRLGKTETTHSVFRVSGQTIYMTDRDDKTGKEETVTQTIVAMENDELVLRDEDRNEYRMKRVGR